VAAFLGQVGGCEVDRQVLVGQPEADGVKGIANTLAALGNGLVGQPDDGEGGLSRGDPDLDLDRSCLYPDERQS